MAEAANRIRSDGDESDLFMVDVIQDCIDESLRDLKDDSDKMREFESLLENFDVDSFMEKFEPSTSEVEYTKPELENDSRLATSPTINTRDDFLFLKGSLKLFIKLASVYGWRSC